jgi:hypothetical protein
VTISGRVSRALRARRDEKGATIVEAAIIVPLLALLTFGAIEFGIGFRDSAAVSASTRGGARLASALTGAETETFAENTRLAVKDALNDLLTADPELLLIYRADENGNPIGGIASCTDCFRYDWEPNTREWINQSSGDTWSLDERTADVCAGTLPSVGVYVRAKQPFITGLFGASKTLTHKTAMRLEPPAPEQCNG